MALSTRRSPVDVAEQASRMFDDLKKAGAAARDTTTARAQALRENANQYLAEARSKAREVGESVQTRVQEQPLRSLVVAAAVGFLLGALVKRR